MRRSAKTPLRFGQHRSNGVAEGREWKPNSSLTAPANPSPGPAKSWLGLAGLSRAPTDSWLGPAELLLAPANSWLAPAEPPTAWLEPLAAWLERPTTPAAPSGEPKNAQKPQKRQKVAKIAYWGAGTQTFRNNSENPYGIHGGPYVQLHWKIIHTLEKSQRRSSSRRIQKYKVPTSPHIIPASSSESSCNSKTQSDAPRSSSLARGSS